MPNAKPAPTPDLEHIVPQLRQLAVPVDALVEDQSNVRNHDRRNLDAIGYSLKQFGQRLPLVVQKEGMVVRAGNGRLRVAREFGWTHIAAVVVDEDAIEATAYAIADNRSAEMGAWDHEGLERLLRELEADGSHPLPELGWEDWEVDALGLSSEWKVPDMKEVEEGGGAMLGTTVKFSEEQRAELNKSLDVAVEVGCPEEGALAEQLTWVVVDWLSRVQDNGVK